MFADIKITIGRAIRILSKERARFMSVMALCVAGGAVELVGVGTLYPFLSLLARPELIEKNKLLHAMYEFGGFASVRNFMILSGCLALVFFFLTNLFLFVKNAYITKYCVGQSAGISTRLLDSYLRKPMAFHLNSNSGALSKDVIEQSDQFANAVLMAVMTLFSDGAILLVLVALVLVVNTKVGLVAILVMGIVLGGMLSLTRSRITRLGMANDAANAVRFVFVVGALQAIKEIKTSGRENYFVEQFRQYAGRMADCYTKLSIFQLLPSFLTQFAAAAAIIGIALYYLIAGDEISTVMPTLIMYAVVGYRLMPSLTKLATAVSSLRQYHAVVQNVSQILDAPPQARQDMANEMLPQSDGLPAVEFRNIAFAYEGAEEAQFKSLSFQIAPRTLVGIAGPSGAGKTTIVDLMLGLLDAQGGDVFVEGAKLKTLSNDDLRKIFAYVPQSVYLVDGTIADNIAFGIPPEKIDWDRIREVVRLCHLEDFVGGKAEGLLSPVGERGARLSGGQRQRVGIARALYEKPSILILDESTSSLDGISEQAIVATLMELKQQITIITIAHRKSLIQHCDRIMLLDHGEIVGDGDFRKLMETSSLFAILMSEMERDLH